MNTNLIVLVLPAAVALISIICYTVPRLRYGKNWRNRMKNRDKYIVKVNEYDMLCKIQVEMICHNCCVIEALSGAKCPKEKVCWADECRECLQKWLNEEG